MFPFFKNDEFKKVKWIWIIALVLLIWQIYSNLTGDVMLQTNDSEWNANGPGYHK
jgi:hypothetical protein